jgi:hypothetical protein
MSAREHLTRLIDLASGSEPHERRALALELADIVLDWPEDYPAHMRASFTLLLEKLVTPLDCQTRKELAARFVADPAAPLGLLNEFFFDCGHDMRQAIVARNALEHTPCETPGAPIDEPSLVQAAREYPPETFAQMFARLLGIPVAVAGRAIADTSGEGLALLCKGARLSRATFSTIAVLSDASLDSAERKLELYETVPEETSIRMIQVWRQRRDGYRTVSDGIRAA